MRQLVRRWRVLPRRHYRTRAYAREWTTAQKSKQAAGSPRDETQSEDQHHDRPEILVPLNILVCDDQQDLLVSLRATLTSMGSEVLTFSDSREAAERVKVQRFDAIFVDVQMPHLSGYELTALIRASALNAKVPVVMLTDQDDIQTMRAAFKAGATYFLGKPVLVERVQGLFNAVLGPVLMQRRKHARLPFQASVKCLSSAAGAQPFVARILNISVSGIAIEGSRGIEVGQLLGLEFFLPSVDRLLHLPAKVQRLMPPNQFGAHFIDPPAADLDAIQSFIFPPEAPAVLKGPADRAPAKESATRQAWSLGDMSGRRRSVLKPIAYVTAAVLLLFLGYVWVARLRAPAAARDADSGPVQKLACTIQSAPPGTVQNSGDAGEARFVTLTPAIIQGQALPGVAASYVLTLTNQSGQDLAFKMAAEDMIEVEGKLVHLAAGELAKGVAATAVFSSSTVSVPSGQAASVKVTLAPPVDSSVHAALISWNGTDQIRAWRGMLVQASPGAMINFSAPAAAGENAGAPAAAPPSSTPNYLVCEWLAP